MLPVLTLTKLCTVKLFPIKKFDLDDTNFRLACTQKIEVINSTAFHEFLKQQIPCVSPHSPVS